MASYSPAPFPQRRSPKDNLVTEFRYQVRLAYYRFEINTAQYVMSPGEKFAYNLALLFLLTLLTLAIFYYIPASCLVGTKRLARCLTGSYQAQLQADSVERAMQRAMRMGGEASASLIRAGTANALNISMGAFGQ